MIKPCVVSLQYQVKSLTDENEQLKAKVSKFEMLSAMETLDKSLAIRDLEQQAKGLEEMLDVTDTWSVMNTYAITVDDIYEQMQELRKQAAKLKESM